MTLFCAVMTEFVLEQKGGHDPCRPSVIDHDETVHVMQNPWVSHHRQQAQ